MKTTTWINFNTLSNIGISSKKKYFFKNIKKYWDISHYLLIIRLLVVQQEGLLSHINCYCYIHYIEEYRVRPIHKKWRNKKKKRILDFTCLDGVKG
jgi:hypothetical protein